MRPSFLPKLRNAGKAKQNRGNRTKRNGSNDDSTDSDDESVVEAHLAGRRKASKVIYADYDSDSDAEGDGASDSDNESVVEAHLASDSDDEDLSTDNESEKNEKQPKCRGTYEWQTIRELLDNPDLAKDVFGDEPLTGRFRKRLERYLIGCELLEPVMMKLNEIDFPTNPLDNLLNELGGPAKVAEMTGRKTRLVRRGGAVVFEKREANGVSLDKLNLEERRAFQAGEKR
jgi:hypothetical protein